MDLIAHTEPDGMTQAGLVCLMVMSVLPILAIPSAWREGGGWRRYARVAGCILMYLFFTALTVGYVLLYEMA